MRHGDGLVLGQVRVAATGNERTAAPALLAGRALARQILDQGGHDLMLVKENHPTMHEAIARLIASPPPPEPGDQLASCTTVERGHGRLEPRTLDRGAALNAYLDWPGVGQLLRRTYRAVHLATSKVSYEVTAGVTSLPVPAVAVEGIAACLRAPWTRMPASSAVATSPRRWRPSATRSTAGGGAARRLSPPPSATRAPLPLARSPSSARPPLCNRPAGIARAYACYG